MDIFILALDIMFISIVIISITLILYYGINIIKFKPLKDPIEIKNYKYAILIPARNESKVIRPMLESILEQVYRIDTKDVYVIVEDIDDPTVEIVKELNMSYYVRENIGEKRRKGYALDECIKDILKKGLRYDAYFIFDADNRIDKMFFNHMNESFNRGYDIAIGYRNSTNWDRSCISVCSGLTFTMINNFGNIERMRKKYNVVISGTGYYIKGSIIEKLNGFPFHALTEDYELSLYSTLNKLKTTYNYDAQYYDEQPTTMSQSSKQRKRWVKGYLESRKHYSKDIKKECKKEKNINYRAKSLGVWPFVILILLLMLYFVTHLVLGSIEEYNNFDSTFYFLRASAVVLYVYVALMVFTLILIILENKRAKFKKKTIIKALLFNPIFLSMYVHIFIMCLFSKKEVKWDRIEHRG